MVRRSTALASITLAACFGLMSGCLVDRPIQARWDCTSDLDCDLDFACVALASGEKTCAQRCTGSCDDDATSCISLTRGDAPAVSVCVHTCQVAADGVATSGCPQGFQCARQGYPASGSSSTSGLCVPNLTCQSNTDCGEGSQCTSGLAPQSRNVPNMLCLSAPDTLDQCPMPSVAVVVNGATSCLPTCTQTACPPAMTCYLERGQGFGLRASQSPCYLGFYGAPCETQTDCFVGQCINVAGRQQCTERCDAAAVRGNCANLSSLVGPYGVHLSFSCDRDSAGLPTCFAEGGVGHLCRDASDCRSGLGCGDNGYCTSPCTTDRQCGDTRFPALSNGWCDGLECAPRLAEGATCNNDRTCATGLCAATTVGSTFEPTCTRPRPEGGLCSRDLDCSSGDCQAGFPGLCRGS